MNHKQGTGRTMQEDPHEALIESSLPLLFATRTEALDHGLHDPVLFLVDCEDPMGGEMARAWVGDDAVDDAVILESASRENDDTTTVLARAVPWTQCQKEVPGTFPYLAAVFEKKPDQDGFLVISVTNAGAAAFTVPLES
ncbi:MAG: hypothetical protein JW829_08085 [Pirellulales bacterium]|nr:hypothetical protein [Pirellulales bacterium]